MASHNAFDVAKMVSRLLSVGVCCNWSVTVLGTIWPDVLEFHYILD